MNRLCAQCEEIPFDRVFQSDGNIFVHQLPDARTREARCDFCSFLALVEKNIISPYLRDCGENRLERSTLRLVSHSSQKPWFDIAGIEASDLPRPAIAWLQVAQASRDPVNLSEPYISICQVPDSETDIRVNEARSKLQYAIPRRRLPNEASRGLVNSGLVQEWLGICQNTHTDLCRLSTVSFKRQFLDTKFIDVQSRRIVPDTKSDPYVALSYVWGEHHPKKSDAGRTFSRKRPLAEQETNMLYTDLPQHVPKTISDAMKFVEQLGLKYLWVDWYCVDQEDDNVKQAQLDNMHLIYECAYLTIIALDSRSMEDGISGISRPFKYTSQPEVEISEGKFRATFLGSMWDNQGNSPWDLRAWTLQEALLSRRCLYFDSSHVYMTCAQEIFHDSLEVDEDEDRLPLVQSDSFYWQNGFEVILTNEEWSQTTYGAFVDCYTRRQLTYQSDALRACSAALTKITHNTGVGFIWGLPLKGLAKALLWQAAPGNCLQRRVGFPSWTWLGWNGRVCYNYWLEEADDYYNSGEAEIQEDRRKDNGLMRQDRPSADSLFQHDVRENDVAAIQIKQTQGPEQTRVLTISSTVARFMLDLVGHDEGHFNDERTSSAEMDGGRCMGDQWTLLSRRGERLVNEVGEDSTFEKSHTFFRLHSRSSKVIHKTSDTSHEFLFIEYWPVIRDHHKSSNWLYDMVSALLIVKDKTGRYHREAAVTIKCSDWLAARPLPKVVELQ